MADDKSNAGEAFGAADPEEVRRRRRRLLGDIEYAKRKLARLVQTEARLLWEERLKAMQDELAKLRPEEDGSGDDDTAEQDGERARKRQTLGDGILRRGQAPRLERLDRRPVVLVDRQDGDASLSVVALVVKGNDPPELFRHGDASSSPAKEDPDHVERLVLAPLDRDGLRDRLEWISRPQRRTRNGPVPASYPAPVLELTLARLVPVMSVVRFLTESAVFSSTDYVLL